MLRTFAPKRGVLPELITEDSVDYAPSDLEAIHFISSHIGFINQYRYRDHLFLGKGYTQQQCHLDIEAREDYVEKFLKETDRAELRANLAANLSNNHVAQGDMMARHHRLTELLKEFDNYKYFAHLTAIEVAVVSGYIEKLYAYISNQIGSMQNSDIKKQLDALLRFMEALEVAMYDHMKKHINILNQNEEKQSAKNKQHAPYHGDVVFEFYKDIRALFIGRTNFVEPQNLILDNSLLTPIPVLPLDLGMEEEKIALNYFKQFVACYEEKVKNRQGVRGMMSTVTGLGYSAVTGTFSLGIKLVKLPFQALGFGVSEIYNAGYHFFGGNKSVVDKPQYNIETHNNSLPKEQKAAQAKTVMQSLQQNKEAMEKIRQENEKKYLERDEVKAKFSAWKNRIKDAKEILQSEIREWSTGCFAFLFISKVATKQKKLDALQDLNDASNCQALLDAVEDQCQSKDKPAVFQGLFSHRTEKLFRDIKIDLSTVLNR